MSIKGFPSNQKLPLGSGITTEYVTIQPTDGFRNALDIPRFAFRVGGNTPRVAGAGTGNSNGLTWVYDTATPARRGDFVRFETGAAAHIEVPIVKVETNKFLLGAFLDPAPAQSDTFFIMRYATQRVAQDGTQILTVSQAPVSFVLNNVTTNVSEDTNVPANSRPLPVKVLNSSGSPQNLATEATLAAADTKLGTISTNIASINAKDFATQTTLAAADTKLGTISTNIASINAKDFATQTTLAAADTKLGTISTNIASINAKDFATQTTLAALDSKVGDIRKVDGGNIFAGVGGVTSGGTFKGMNVSSAGDVYTLEQGRQVIETVRFSYSSTPVNTTNWQQLVASMPAQTRRISIFDSSGQTMELGVGPPSSETRVLLIFPGGNGHEPLALANGVRVSVRAVSATANVGEIVINFFA